MEDITRDLWREARGKTRAKSKASAWDQFKGIVQKAVSMPGQPTRTATLLPSRSDAVWMIDLSKYEPRDLRPYIDAGVKAFMFRMGGPTQWTLDSYKYAIDPTYRTNIEQAERYGVLGQTIGYIVHNPFETVAINGATGETIHTELIDEWTSGGYMPASFCYDHEVSTCWTSVGAKITCTPYNIINSLAENTLNTYRKFRRTVSVYSAKWFMNQSADYWLRHDTWFTNINKPESAGGAGLQRPLMMAYYPQDLGNSQFINMAAVGTTLLTPTPEQVAKYLYCGYQANCWQFTDRLRIGTLAGVDMSLSLDASGAFWGNFGLTKPGTVTPPEPPPVDTDVEKRLKALEDTLVGHTHQTFIAVPSGSSHTHNTGLPIPPKVVN